MKTYYACAAMLLCGCQSPEPAEHEALADYFVFSNAHEFANYSLLFPSGDTIYLEKLFPAPPLSAYGLLRPGDRRTLDSLLASALLTTPYDTVYARACPQDGDEFNYYFAWKARAHQRVYTCAKEGPPELYQLATWVQELKEKTLFIPRAKPVLLKKHEYIPMPQPPPEPRK